MKLNKIIVPKNKFYIQYSVSHTDVNERDSWITLPFYELTGVEDFKDLEIFIECFKAVAAEIDKSRQGYGYQVNYIDFDKVAENLDCEKVEWMSGDGVLIVKGNKEFFIDVCVDIGMPTEDGYFVSGIVIGMITYFDKDGIEYIVEY